MNAGGGDDEMVGSHGPLLLMFENGVRLGEMEQSCKHYPIFAGIQTLVLAHKE